MESSQLAFTRFFFRARNERFVVSKHHVILEEALSRVERGKTKNLLITIPPRYGKTQIAVIDWMARCIAMNPRAKFIHLSYSDDLALDNSAKCRELVATKEYQSLWGVQIKKDADSKKKWYTTEGGGVYATSAGGPVTGFGAGSLADVPEEIRDEEFDHFFAGADEDVDENKFYGAIIIDDPIKVDDAYNQKERDKVNFRLNSTIKSRRNSRNTPIIIIMQRLHEDDMAGFVLAGGMQEPFEHVNLPAIDEDGNALWPYKHTLEELQVIKLADNAVFQAQYLQNPTPDDGVFFKAEWFAKNRYRIGEEPTRLVKYGAGDYAVTEDAGDWTEQAIAGFDTREDLWILDWWSKRCTLDVSIDHQVQMVVDNDPVLWVAESGVIRRAMEPFVQKEQRRRRVYYKLEWLAATKSKAVNAKAFQALAASGKVHIPYGSWGDDLIAQLLRFTGKQDKIDDKVDVCGLFGRLLGQAYGPSQYHDQMKTRQNGDDYEYDDEDDDGDWRTR